MGANALRILIGLFFFIPAYGAIREGYKFIIVWFIAFIIGWEFLRIIFVSLFSILKRRLL